MDTASDREPRQERSRVTRARLLDAAVGCLAERGVSGATVGAVAERAGVSRGAAQHHFPTREGLLLAALRHMVESRSADLRRRADAVPAGPERTEAVGPGPPVRPGRAHRPPRLAQRRTAHAAGRPAMDDRERTENLREVLIAY
ncbi:TetR/AcrR family transcriptional regulator, partial [Nocardiopsis alba]|uniref:TetR/AcrR family transcriptional regulator n=1 Tax=Nocardiopsis alba TaxID=53437 RepID=UPI0033C8BFC9